ncbi:uncharacterized protein LOC132387301 [Hypanus sabinus]|uniref:uncharacterized protein LOC132387301 n=1 Tax=Hypanus sabinus TaxID=79690 RepID=UPI0028C39655|nr:uncharacterized protein LOC132387301 [Hypanus sabinus]
MEKEKWGEAPNGDDGQGVNSRWSFPALGQKCKQDDDKQPQSRKSKGERKVLKRFLPGGSSREDDRDMGSKVPKQGQTESNVPMECSPAAAEVEQNPEFTISDLLAEGGEYRLYQLTKFYRDRLKQAIEEKVERLGWMLTKEGHFSREENEKVTELTEKGNRTESSILFLSLVMGKGSRVRRAMWECFVTWRTELPKLDRILREIQELGPDPQEYMNIAQGLSELPTQLIDVQQKHKETLREQTETLRVNTILMREKVKVFQLVDRYAELTVISTVRDRTLVEHELLARGRDHEEWTEKHLRQDLDNVGLTYSAAEDLASALSTNRSLTELDLSHNKLGDSGVKLVSAALRNSECKIQKLWLRDVGLTDSGAEDLVSALRINPSLTWINLGTNSLTDRSVPALRRLILTLPSPELIRLDGNQFSENGRKELGSLQVPRPGLRVICEQLNE